MNNSNSFNNLPVGVALSVMSWAGAIYGDKGVQAITVSVMTAGGAAAVVNLPEGEAADRARLFLSALCVPADDVYLVAENDNFMLILLSDGRTVWPTIEDAPRASMLLDPRFAKALAASDNAQARWAERFGGDDKPESVTHGTASGLSLVARMSGNTAAAEALDKLAPDETVICVMGKGDAGAVAYFLHADGSLVWSSCGGDA